MLNHPGSARYEIAHSQPPSTVSTPSRVGEEGRNRKVVGRAIHGGMHHCRLVDSAHITSLSMGMPHSGRLDTHLPPVPAARLGSSSGTSKRAASRPVVRTPKVALLHAHEQPATESPRITTFPAVALSPSSDTPADSPIQSHRPPAPRASPLPLAYGCHRRRCQYTARALSVPTTSHAHTDFWAPAPPTAFAPPARPARVPHPAAMQLRGTRSFSVLRTPQHLVLATSRQPSRTASASAHAFSVLP
ncbi:hypothetical protein C8R47DRAFT_1326287 [Mycena vitilis]|nr:hypothetical protein C8R47DRAFT_1326287 [Mycena vitilis]